MCGCEFRSCQTAPVTARVDVAVTVTFTVTSLSRLSQLISKRRHVCMCVCQLEIVKMSLKNLFLHFALTTQSGEFLLIRHSLSNFVALPAVRCLLAAVTY